MKEIDSIWLCPPMAPHVWLEFGPAGNDWSQVGVMPTSLSVPLLGTPPRVKR